MPEERIHRPTPPAPTPPRLAWYRLANGTWTSAEQIDTRDALASAQYIHWVRGGAITPATNPAIFVLPSKRKLMFSWEIVQQALACVITDVFWCGNQGQFPLSERPI